MVELAVGGAASFHLYTLRAHWLLAFSHAACKCDAITLCQQITCQLFVGINLVKFVVVFICNNHTPQAVTHHAIRPTETFPVALTTLVCSSNPTVKKKQKKKQQILPFLLQCTTIPEQV